MTETTVFKSAEELERDRVRAILDFNTGPTLTDESMEVTRNPVTGRSMKGCGFGSDENLIVTFDLEPVLDKGASIAAGRPIYRDMEFITEIPPGDKSKYLKVRAPVTEFHKWRFPVDYANWKKGQVQRQEGTPLAAFTRLTPSLVKDLEAQYVFTVEQFINLTATNAANFPNFHQLQRDARTFLESLKSSVVVDVMQDELAKRDEELRQLKEQLAQIVANQSASTQAAPVPKPAAKRWVKKKTT